MKRILFLSYAKTGGAGIAANRIAECLADSKEVEIEFWDAAQLHVKLKPSRGIFYFIKYYIFFHIFSKRAFSVFKQYDYFSNAKTPFSTRLDDNLLKKFDAIHLHWISNQIDYVSFFHSIPKSIPVFWTIHDLNPFTGGCHYAWDCTKYQISCYECPQLPKDKWFDLASNNFRTKKKAYKNANLVVLPNSRWTDRRVKESALFRNYNSFIMKIPLDINIFYPKDKVKAREDIGLYAGSFFYISFGAISIHSKRKGLSELLSALKILAKKNLNIKILLFGSNSEIEFGLDGLESVSFGEISSLDTLRNIYSASDIFVVPSLQESFGQTCLEAMSCGVTPIGFKGSGLDDMIIDNETGFLCDVGDSVQLADKIEYLYHNRNIVEAASSKAVSFVSANYSYDVVSKEYENMYGFYIPK